MQSLPDAYRRGRPDIVHLCLLNALESPRNKEGCLRVFVHTRNDEVIRIDPSWRVPKAYHRFVGLMEQLFAERVIRSGGTVLLSLEKKRLADLVREEAGTAPVQVMHAEGAPYRHREDAVVVIGGFPHGAVSPPSLSPLLLYTRMSLWRGPVLNHVLYGGT
jgi:rRNA small subunit pseudouridine methyltransferase Nep1